MIIKHLTSLIKFLSIQRENIMFFIILIFISASNAGDCKCYYDDHVYTCGATLKTLICCKSGWEQCTDGWILSSCQCKKPAPKYTVDNTFIDDESYSFTEDGRMMTEYVTVGKLVKGKYVADQLVHSSELKGGEMIMWPAYDSIINGKTNTNVVMKLEKHHLNVDGINFNCCASVEINYWFSSECKQKMCCGEGCCC